MQEDTDSILSLHYITVKTLVPMYGGFGSDVRWFASDARSLCFRRTVGLVPTRGHFGSDIQWVWFRFLNAN